MQTILEHKYIKPLIAPQVIQFVGLFLIGLFGFALVKYFVVRPARDYSEITMLISTVIFLVLTWHVKRRDLPASMLLIMNFMFVLFGLYQLFPLTLPTDIDLPTITHYRLQYGPWLFSCLCFLGIWRPVLGVIGVTATLWTRITMSDILGSGLSYTEYFPIAEITIFMLCSAAAYPFLKKTKYFTSIDKPMDKTDKLTVLEKIALCGVAVHLSNYMYSGIKKVFLGEFPLSWVFNNETWNLALASNALGHLPIGFNETLTGLSIVGLQYTFVVANFLIFGGQLLAIMGAFRVRWIIALTAFYDVTHIVIFLVSGIFFYKWIVFNLAIIAAMTVIREKVIPLPMRWILIITMICAPNIFFIAKLGWWDTKSLNHERFYAIIDDGQEIEVPTNYWGSFSVQYAQSRRIRDKSEGYFPTGTAAIIFGQERMFKANTCQYEPDLEKDIIANIFKDEGNDIAQNVRLVHRYTLENIDDKGRRLYDAYPHHIWSMPWNFVDFYNLDKRSIVAYKYVIDAVCLDFKDGQFTSELKRHGSALIDVSDIK